ncbi:hypothetical protein CDAR_105621 [Caerostris darwini]|uniref:Uncharacterized protein n=1 Tax=Caerostris darwini TaxID=1538125 RepID=A0AAV4V0F2_9ARAC|nr:hypothetical protein CDAR_105621 [Caerostris darwini]
MPLLIKIIHPETFFVLEHNRVLLKVIMMDENSQKQEKKKSQSQKAAVFRFIYSFAIHNFSTLTRDRPFLSSQGLPISCAPQNSGERENEEKGEQHMFIRERAIKGRHCCVFIKAVRLCSSALTEFDDVGAVLQIFVSWFWENIREEWEIIFRLCFASAICAIRQC